MLFAIAATAVKTQAGGIGVEAFDSHVRCASLMSFAMIDGPSDEPGHASHADAAGEAATAGAALVGAVFAAQPVRAARARTTAERYIADGRNDNGCPRLMVRSRD